MPHRCLATITTVGLLTLASRGQEGLVEATCPSGTSSRGLGTIGIETPKSPIVDASEDKVTLLVRFNTNGLGSFPVGATSFAVVPEGQEPVLADGNLGSANKRLVGARRDWSERAFFDPLRNRRFDGVVSRLRLPALFLHVRVTCLRASDEWTPKSLGTERRTVDSPWRSRCA